MNVEQIISRKIEILIVDGVMIISYRLCTYQKLSSKWRCYYCWSACRCGRRRRRRRRRRRIVRAQITPVEHGKR
jgi:hypothetical protein